MRIMVAKLMGVAKCHSFSFANVREIGKKSDKYIIVCAYEEIFDKDWMCSGAVCWRTALAEVLSNFAHSDEFKGIMEEYGV